jgi:hypothetical protein
VSPDSLLHRQLAADKGTEVNYLQNEDFVVSISWNNVTRPLDNCRCRLVNPYIQYGIVSVVAMELPIPLQIRPSGAAAFCVSCAEGITSFIVYSRRILTGSSGIFILRTYALWGHKKSILGLMLSTVLVRIQLRSRIPY